MIRQSPTASGSTIQSASVDQRPGPSRGRRARSGSAVRATGAVDPFHRPAQRVDRAERGRARRAARSRGRSPAPRLSRAAPKAIPITIAVTTYRTSWPSRPSGSDQTCGDVGRRRAPCRAPRRRARPRSRRAPRTTPASTLAAISRGRSRDQREADQRGPLRPLGADQEDADDRQQDPGGRQARWRGCGGRCRSSVRGRRCSGDHDDEQRSGRAPTAAARSRAGVDHLAQLDRGQAGEDGSLVHAVAASSPLVRSKNSCSRPASSAGAEVDEGDAAVAARRAPTARGSASTTKPPPSASRASRPGRREGAAERLAVVGADQRAGAGEQLVARALGDDPAVADDHQPVGDRVDLVQQVRGEQHGAAAVGEVAQQAAHPAHPLGVEAVGGLVEDQHLGFAEQRVAIPSRWRMPSEYWRTRLRGGAGRGRPARAARRRGPPSTPIVCAETRQRLAAAAAGVLGGGVEQHADPAARVGAARGTAPPSTAEPPASGSGRARRSSASSSSSPPRWGRGTRSRCPARSGRRRRRRPPSRRIAWSASRLRSCPQPSPSRAAPASPPVSLSPRPRSMAGPYFGSGRGPFPRRLADERLNGLIRDWERGVGGEKAARVTETPRPQGRCAPSWGFPATAIALRDFDPLWGGQLTQRVRDGRDTVDFATSPSRHPRRSRPLRHDRGPRCASRHESRRSPAPPGRSSRNPAISAAATPRRGRRRDGRVPSASRRDGPSLGVPSAGVGGGVLEPII